MKTKLIFASFFVAVLIPASFTLAQQPPSNPPKLTKKVVPITAPRIGDYLYQDNSTLPNDRIIPESAIRARVQENVTLISIKLLRYKDFIANRKNNGQGDQQNMTISPERLVYEVIAEKRNFKTRAGTFEFATVTTLVDAETGENLTVDIKAPASAFKPSRKGVTLEDLPPEMREQLKK